MPGTGSGGKRIICPRPPGTRSAHSCNRMTEHPWMGFQSHSTRLLGARGTSGASDFSSGDSCVAFGPFIRIDVPVYKIEAQGYCLNNPNRKEAIYLNNILCNT